MSKSIKALLLAAITLFMLASFGCFGTGYEIPEVPEVPLPTETYTPIANTGTIEGFVYIADDGGSSYPAPHALVAVIDQGISVYTDSYGSFRLTNVWAGKRMLLASYAGSKAVGEVNVIAGGTVNVTIELPAPHATPTPTPTSSPGDNDDTGTLRIITYSFYENGEWVGVEYIRVWEYGNYANRWYQSWNETGYWGTVSYELDCYNAKKGRYYEVEIGWYNGDYEIYEVYLYKDDQTEYFYHY